MAQFSNQAVLSYRGLTVNSNIVTGEITQVLTMSKTKVNQSYGEGDSLVYVLSIENDGTTSFDGVSISDNLGAYTFGNQSLTPLTFSGDPVLYYVNGNLQPSPTAQEAGNVLTISGISIPAGGNATVIYRVNVNEFAPLAEGSVITNTATLSAGLAEAVEASEDISAVALPALTIFKEVDSPTVQENGSLTYTFTIRNSGAAATTEADNVIVTDTFTPPFAEPISVTLNGAPLTLNTDYTYNAATGEFATLDNVVTVPAATYTQDSVSGVVSMTPGIATITVTGNLT